MVQEVAEEYSRWCKEQERSCLFLKSLMSTAESLEILSRTPKDDKSRWGVLASFHDLPDRLLVKEVDSVNRISAKLKDSLKKFENACSSVKRIRKKAFRLVREQKDLLLTDLSQGSAVSFSVSDKLSWFDTLERALGEELAIKSALLENVRLDKVAQVSSLLEKWERQAYLEALSSSVLDRLKFSVSANV